MALREKFGKLVLLEKLDESSFAASYRAARVSGSGLDRIVTLVRYADAVSTHPEAAPRLMEEARAASRLHIPGLVRTLGIGRVERSYYASLELLEGRSLRATIDRAFEESFPFAAENALMVASRAAAVLESLHGRQDGKGHPLAHGLVSPSQIVLTWEGDVRLGGLGVWPSLRGTGLLGEAEQRYLAPEQAAGERGGPSSDVYSLALVLLETLSRGAAESPDRLGALESARFVTTTGEEEPLPRPLVALLELGLAPDPASRYPSMGEMRQAIDTLLFSGDFTPTTFNLAYFMQTIFREEMEREAATLAAERQADYSEFLPAPAPDTPEPASGEPPAAARGAARSRASDVGRRRGPDASGGTSGRRARPRMSAEGSGRMFARAHQAETPRRGLALVAGLVLAVLLGGGTGYLYFVKLRPRMGTTSAATLSPDAEAALARVRELEAQLAALQREQAAAEAERQAREAAEPASSPSPSSRPGSRAAAAAEEARRRRARARQAARLQAIEEEARRAEEIRRLEEEMRAAEAVLVAEQRTDPGDIPALPAVLPPPPTPAPTLPPVRPGDLVSIEDPEVVAPVPVSSERLVPPFLPSGRAKAQVSVVVRALVDEKGQVEDARILESSGSGYGYDAKALEHTRTMRYRPATKRGVPVKTWIIVRATFK
jgi:TonB family protein